MWEVVSFQLYTSCRHAIYHSPVEVRVVWGCTVYCTILYMYMYMLVIGSNIKGTAAYLYNVLTSLEIVYKVYLHGGIELEWD